MFCTLSPSSKNHMDVRGCFMIRQGCCWTGYSEQSYSNRIGITAPSLPPSFSLSPPSPSFSFFFFLCPQASVREDGCFHPPCARTLSLGICFLLISLANPLPLLARISPGISKEAVNYAGYSFICSSLQCFKKKNTKPKQLCAHAVQQLPSEDF